MNESKQDIRAITVASDYYDSHPEVKMAISLIPVIGGALNEMLSGPANVAQNKRMFDFMTSVGQQLERHEARLDDVFASSPEFECVVERILRSASQTSREEKLEILRQAMVGAIRTAAKDPLTPSPLDALDVLSPEHIRLLTTTRLHIERGVAQYDAEQGTDQSAVPIADLGDGFCPGTIHLRQEIPEWSTPGWNSILDDLLARGFLEVVPPIQGVLRPKKQELYRPTYLGLSLLDLLQTGVGPTEHEPRKPDE